MKMPELGGSENETKANKIIGKMYFNSKICVLLIYNIPVM